MNPLFTHFDTFVNERRWLKNVTPATVRWYGDVWKSLDQHLPEVTSPEGLTKDALQRWVVRLREAGLRPVTVNNRLSGLNAFLLWLHAEGHLPAKLRVPLLRTEHPLIQVFDREQVKRLLAIKPRSIREHRSYALDCLLLDTGLRIEEALTLTHPYLDLNNLLVTVWGKGRKERRVPMSLTLRGVLVRWHKLQSRKQWTPSPYVFPASTGTRLTHRNMLRGHYWLLKQAGIPKCGFHRLRHTFATQYLQAGGEVVRLQRILGHSNIATTMTYVHLQTDDLQQPHQNLSLLNRLR